jgi:aryl-alcohol dehydrogenase-like predicted oxidoreductase
VGPETIRRAAAAHPICDLQIEYSLISRGIEGEILPTCRDLGIGVTAYGVLSRGLISGHFAADRELPANDFRAHAPRFAKENRERNLALVDALREVADASGVTVAQVAIAWVLSRGEDIVPLVGARTRERLHEALGALEANLDADDLAALERAVPPDAAAGDRYPEAQMAVLDSERG